MKFSLAGVGLLMFAAGQAAAAEANPVRTLSLENPVLTLEVTPDIGGRVLSVARRGQDNILKLGKAAQHQATPAANSDFIPWFGHEMWVGPQSQWWIHQTVNPQRAAAKAVWPPDPWLVQGVHKVLQHSAQLIELESPASPVSGVQMRKRWQLMPDQPDSVFLEVEAVNIRSEAVAWDLWFNTRLHPQTRVYAPVADPDQARIQQITDEQHAELDYQWHENFFTLNLAPVDAPAKGRRGKVFIQPDAGWMAGFYGNQVLIIHFPLQPAEAIHPEQGQIELYLEYYPQDETAGLLEMEVHAPYRQLAPGETMVASEVWTLLDYPGAANPDAELAFLQEHIPLLNARLKLATYAP